jgi:hypothetical protein
MWTEIAADQDGPQRPIVTLRNTNMTGASSKPRLFFRPRRLKMALGRLLCFNGCFLQTLSRESGPTTDGTPTGCVLSFSAPEPGAVFGPKWAFFLDPGFCHDPEKLSQRRRHMR